MEIVLVGGHFDGETIVTADGNPFPEYIRMVLPPPVATYLPPDGPSQTTEFKYEEVEYRRYRCRDNTIIYKAV